MFHFLISIYFPLNVYIVGLDKLSELLLNEP
jgi:hypothetical protein